MLKAGQSHTKSILLLLIPIAGLPLLIWGESTEPILPIRWMALAFLGLAFMAVLGREFWESMLDVPRWPLVFWAAFLALGAISSIFGIVPMDGFWECMRLLVVTNAWLLFSWAINKSDQPAKWLGISCSIALILISGIAIGQRFGLFAWIPGFETVPTSTMGNPNFLGAALCFLLPGTMLGMRQGLKLGVLAGISICVGVAGMYLAHSLGAWLGLAAGAGIATLYLFPLGFLKKATLSEFRLRSAVLVTACLIFLVGVAVRYGDHVFQQMQTKINLTQDSGTERLLMWQKTLELIAEKPLLGCGPDNWNYAVVEHGLVGQDQGFATRYFMQAHNDYLQAFAEYGILGGLAFVLFLASAWYVGWRRQMSETNKDERWLTAMAMSGLMAWMVNAFFSFPFHRPYLVMMLVVWIAVLGRGATGGFKLDKWKAVSLAFVLGLACLLFGVWSGLKMKAYHANFSVWQAKLRQDWGRVAVLADKAEAWYNHEDGISKTPIAWYKGNALLNLQRNEEALSALGEAKHAYPSHPMVRSNYAVALAMTGKTTEAIAELEQLLAVFPDFDEARINLISVYLSTRDLKNAEKMLKHWAEPSTNGNVNRLREELGKLKKEK